MSEKLDLDGVTLTLDECKAVLAWVDDPLSPLPQVLFHNPQRHMYLTSSDVDEPRGILLTADLVERIRDWAYPWTEVSLAEPQMGTRAIISRDRREYLLGERTFSSGGRMAWDTEAGHSTVLRVTTVLVRRPRKPALTLRDVERGQRVEDES